MAVHNPVQHGPHAHGTEPEHRSFRVTTWVLGIVGGVAAFFGLFILLGGEDQSIGLGGGVSWQVSELDPMWGYGLAAVGALALVGALVLGLAGRKAEAGEQTRGGWSDVTAHAAIFLVVNAFLWAQDIALGDGLNYALWTTIPWGIGLGAHALATYFDLRKSAQHQR